MRSIARITREMLTRYAQVLLVIITFALMVIFSYSFVSKTERNHLRRNAQEAISYTGITVKSDMLELETLLGVVSETLNDMIIKGESSDSLNDYILFINTYVENGRDKRLYGATGVFGVFDVFDGVMLIGYERWVPPNDYYQTERPWYTGAVKKAGEINMTEPYKNEYSNELTITLSRQIFDDDGNALGIVCLNIEFDRIAQYVVNTQFVEGGYGFLLSENFMIIAHPDRSMVGLPFRDVKSGIAALMDELYDKGRISEATTYDYRGINVIVYMEKLGNGWYMGVVTPRNSYFQSTRNLAITLAALGAVFAALLISMLLRISSDKNRAVERMQIMFNATPLVMYIFNKDLEVIDCNNNAVTLFDLSSKKEFCDRFYDLIPEYQMDGRPTAEISMGIIRKTLEEGSSHFEWLHKKLSGELIPCEITLVHHRYQDDFILIGYMRDLREQKKMMREIQQRSHLLDTANNAATILLSNYNVETFEDALLRSFAVLGICLDVDRVQIWRNEEIDNDLHFVLRYEWLSEHGKTCRPVPIGLHYPYNLKPDWERKFSKGEYINAPLSELSEEDRAFFGYYGMKTVVMIPMFLDGFFWGIFSINDCRNGRSFSNEEASILASAGLMMSSAINRNVQTIKMREAEERTQIIIDAAPFCVFFWDKDLNLIDCNQETVRLFDLSSKQEFFNTFRELSPEYQPDGRLSREKGVELVQKAVDEGYSRFEWHHQKLNGEQIPVEVTCVRVKYKGEYTVTEYVRDLREQQAMLREMRKADLAEESSKAKSDFLAKMSHEIRTPMNAILGITEIQLQDEHLSPPTKEALERIYNSGDLLLGIINDILDLSKIEAGKMVLIPAQYDIPSLIHDTMQLNMIRYESKPIEFRLDIDENVPSMLIGDELRIKQILNNLLSNAFKYTDSGTITLSVFIEDSNEKKDNDVTLVFSVDDTGQGMTAEQVRRLGSEYARFNMEANRKTEGAGLGMNITRNLIQMMNGNIAIESTPGMGSTFTVRLPQKRVGYSLLGKEQAEKLMNLNIENTSKIRTVQINREFMPYGRVLIVDDVETNLYVAKGLMAPYGLSIDTAMSGFDAVDRIRDGAVYDIIFMDHMMPRMDGIEATKIIRSLGYTKPIVALTANAISGQSDMFMKNGFDEFISKPIDIRQLNMTLNKLVRDKKPTDVIEAARQQKDYLFSAGNQHPLDQQLAEFFVRDARKAISVLEAIYNNKCRRNDDISMLIINVHAMKSALANIGEKVLSAEAAKLEQAGRDRDIKVILSDLPSFLEMLYTIIGKLEPETADKDESADDADYPYLKEKLLAIQEACASMDKKTAKKALAQLKEKTWPHIVKEQLAILSACLLHSEFEEASQVIGDFVNQL